MSESDTGMKLALVGIALILVSSPNGYFLAHTELPDNIFTFLLTSATSTVGDLDLAETDEFIQGTKQMRSSKSRTYASEVTIPPTNMEIEASSPIKDAGTGAIHKKRKFRSQSSSTCATTISTSPLGPLADAGVEETGMASPTKRASRRDHKVSVGSPETPNLTSTFSHVLLQRFPVLHGFLSTAAPPGTRSGDLVDDRELLRALSLLVVSAFSTHLSCLRARAF